MHVSLFFFVACLPSQCGGLFATFYGRHATEVCRLVTPMLDEAGELEMASFARVHRVVTALRTRERSFAIAALDDARMCVFACARGHDDHEHCVHACLWENAKTPLADRVRTVTALRAWHRAHFPNTTLEPGPLLSPLERAAW